MTESQLLAILTAILHREFGLERAIEVARTIVRRIHERGL